ncbi:UgpE ABC-type sugar transport system, permease component [Candidatus Nanopelagicaceae bacterium]|jgi:multiple sugar transport system permease protein
MTTLVVPKRHKRFTGKKVSLTISAWTMGFLFFAPYLQMLLTALKPKEEITAIPSTYLPKKWAFDNFIGVWKEIPLMGFIKSSFIISISATIIVIFIAVPAAYYVARNDFRGKKLFLLLVLVTQMFAPTALVVGIFREIVKFGLVDTYLALILIYAAFNMAFSIWILSSFFSSIPKEIEEAAWIDGCNRFTTLTRIVLPLALPGLVTAFIFTFIAAWNEFVIALTLTSSPEREPLTVGLTSLIGQYQVQWNYLFAGSIIAIVPVVVLFALIEKWLVGGLTAGSVK